MSRLPLTGPLTGLVFAALVALPAFADPLVVYSGAGLRPAIDPLADAVAAETGTELAIEYGGTGQLFARFDQTARGDVFVAGTQFYTDQLEAQGKIDDVVALGIYGAAIAVAKASAGKVTGVADLGTPGLRVALGDAEAMALGRTAEEILEKCGDVDAVHANTIARATTLPQLALYVAEGNVDAAILSPSGAGKSTLLKVVAGLVPYRGRVLLRGQDMAGVPPHRRHLGYLGQELHLFPHLTVRGNLALALRFSDLPRRNRAERIDETLELCAIAYRSERHPAALSGGERQRAALARALVRQPDLLLLDEPFSALDPATRQRLWHDVGRLRRHLGLAALIVTHDPAEAAALADRSVTMRDGRLVSQASKPAGPEALDPRRFDPAV